MLHRVRWLCTLLILLAVAAVQADNITVSTAVELHAALTDADDTIINLSTSLTLTAAWAPITLTEGQNVMICGGHGIAFVLNDSAVPFITVEAGASLTLNALFVRNFAPPVVANGTSSGNALPAIVANGGDVVFQFVKFYIDYGVAQLTERLPFWSDVVTRLQSQYVSGPAAGNLDFPQTWTIASYSGGNTYTFTNCKLVVDSLQCRERLVSANGTLAYSSHSFQAALASHDIATIALLQNITLAPTDFLWDHPVYVSRNVSIISCEQGTVLDFNGIVAAIIVTGDGSVTFRGGLQLAGSKPIFRRTWPSLQTLLLSAVEVNASGGVQLIDVTLIDTGSRNISAQVGQLPAAVRPTLDTFSNGSMLLDTWNLTQTDWAAVAPPPYRHGPTATAAAPAATALPPAYWLFYNVTIVEYRGDSCFLDFPGLVATNALELKGYLQDPDVTHIEIRGDIIFQPSDWPTPSKDPTINSINITSAVDIRACPDEPGFRYTVDFGNMDSVIFVADYMRWQGGLRMINSAALARRAYMWMLIGALSLTDNGIIDIEDVVIEGTHPSPLNEQDSSFWDYNQSQFVPSGNDYVNISYNELLVVDWAFNRTAWALAYRGENATVDNSSWGNDAAWVLRDVAVMWALPGGPGGGGRSPVMFMGMVLAPVLGGSALAAAIMSLWLYMRKRQMAAAAARAKADMLPHDMEAGGGKGLGAAGGNGSSLVIHRDAVLLGGGGQKTGSTGGKTYSASRFSAAASTVKGTEQRIEAARRAMAGGMPQHTSLGQEELVLDCLLGEGTFGKVYKGYWKGSLVAVKTMMLPACMSGQEKRQKMAIMETAISSSLSHPNIVQTYTYSLRALRSEQDSEQPAAGPTDQQQRDSGLLVDGGSPVPALTGSSCSSFDEGDPRITGWQVRLVLEYCDRGSLREALDQRCFLDQGGLPDLQSILDTALDVARALLHLHSSNILHNDLKARNIMLKSCGSDRRGFLAKVADFGLSMEIGGLETHVSDMFQGTMTHMAPEILLLGKVSRASDVYAFGIMLWELYTGGQPFEGVPRVFLGHEVAKAGARPQFQPDAPFEYQLLACRCWETDHAMRPTFEQILVELQRMRAKYCDNEAAGPPPTVGNERGQMLGLASGVYNHQAAWRQYLAGPTVCAPESEASIYLAESAVGAPPVQQPGPSHHHDTHHHQHCSDAHRTGDERPSGPSGEPQQQQQHLGCSHDAQLPLNGSSNHLLLNQGAAAGGDAGAPTGGDEPRHE